ncbi:peptidylprolyl isomerase [Paenibacillus sp. BGI2013]|uniref:Peptidylprolyl isomerase n=1 Tax=Paenibacillus amylolyticus TaxID=1451 RepID=A0ABD8ASZ3_PAEAM|nr:MULTISPECIES: peptidylprolyl isomerase [Paenibacillus]ETT39678.1 Parvulin-like peptidyl-prolyl isomerase [Paenibacillus sp. FSL R5-192]KLU52836.1 peptidylprolyl isomerase [Paenibacillus sp. VT-400]OME91128.1 peptidylprolyl isomerase [Paenibacillus amylolyticus]OME98925.1 peptidylprolyl isomerase [Paenibacillus amylolyticus]OMF38956.1 peptidylprolyl isomerase [Paenibacillus amylolyticus]
MLPKYKKVGKVLSVSMVAVLSLSLLAACGKKEEAKTPESTDTSAVVATYDGGTITANEFDMEQRVMKFLYPEYAQMMDMDDFKEYLVKQEVAYEYLSGKASEEAKTAGTKAATEQFDKMKASVQADQWTEMLKAQKLTDDNIKDYMTRIMTVIKDKETGVTDDAIKAEFEKNKDQFTTASVRHVLINFTDPKTQKERKKEDALKIAKEVKTKLDGGADFAEIAKKYSEDPGSAEKGGLYENTPVGSWVEAFKEAAKTLPLNKISDPVETEYGYHVMKVEARTEADFAKLTAEQKESLKSQLAAAEIDTFMQNELDKIVKEVKLPKTEKAEEGKTEGTTEGTTGTGTEGEKTTEPKTDDSTGTDTKTDQGTTGTDKDATTDEGTSSK